jgi:hypothetical protein
MEFICLHKEVRGAISKVARRQKKLGHHDRGFRLRPARRRQGFQVVYWSRMTNSAGGAAIQMGQRITFDYAEQQVVVAGRR